MHVHSPFTRCGRRRRPAHSREGAGKRSTRAVLVRVNGAGCLPDGPLQVRNAGMTVRVGLLFNHAPHPGVACMPVGQVRGTYMLGDMQGYLPAQEILHALASISCGGVLHPA